MRVSGLLALVVVGAAVISPAWADTIDVYRDAYIDDFTRDQNIPPDGTPDEIRDTNALLASRGEFFDQFNAFNVDGHAIMTFDVSPYAGSTVSSAFLTGYGTRVDNRGSLDPITGEFYVYGGNGLVDFADFNAPATFLGSLSFQPNPQGFDLAPFQLDVTAALQTLLNNPTASYAEFRVESESPTVFINAGEVDPNSGFSVDTRWAGPQLQVALVPEPAGALLMLGGAAAIGAFKRRRHRIR